MKIRPLTECIDYDTDNLVEDLEHYARIRPNNAYAITDNKGHAFVIAYYGELYVPSVYVDNVFHLNSVIKTIEKNIGTTVNLDHEG